MRFERKFELIQSYVNVIPTFLRCNGFKEIYTLRRVNSLYFEDNNFSLYSDAINGHNEKEKIRLRYYNKKSEEGVIEFKRKIGEKNKKDFSLIKGDNIKLLPVEFENTEFKNDKLKTPKTIKGIFFPKLFVSYKRRYFLSSDRKFRITLDYSIQFMRVVVNNKSIKINSPRKYDKSVLEMKYEENYIPDKNFIRRICNTYGLNLSKSSKYSSGIGYMHLA